MLWPTGRTVPLVLAYPPRQRWVSDALAYSQRREAKALAALTSLANSSACCPEICLHLGSSNITYRRRIKRGFPNVPGISLF